MENNEKLNRYIQKLKESFPPADDYKTSSMLLTTLNVIEMINEFDPTIIFTDTDIVKLLQEAGYQSKAVEIDDEIKFVWLMG